MRTIVVGIGNKLLTDDGVGIHISNYLAEHFSNLPETQYIDGGTLSFTLVSMIADADNLIIVDATQLNDEPGTIGILTGDAMDEFIDQKSNCSVHEITLIDLISMLRLLGDLPKNRALVGIQPQRVDWGITPTERVSAAIPIASQKTANLITEWQAC